VRRDATEVIDPRGTVTVAACCASLAGESPVPVGVGAPGSRPQVSEGDLRARAGRQKSATRRKPYGGEQARRPQHQVKLAASTKEQSGSRAAHVTAKAISIARVPKLARDSGGVGRAACVQRESRNTRDPSWSPSSRQGGSYKPKAKSSAAKRKSEGLVVLVNVAQKNATGGKEPCFGHVRGEGKREGMAAKSGPNYPGARRCDVQVRQPQSELGAGAKQHGSHSSGTNEHGRGDARRGVQRLSGAGVVHASSRRPSVSRVREIRTHGLKGGPALSPVFTHQE
jgi:hypothetical protein